MVFEVNAVSFTPQTMTLTKHLSSFCSTERYTCGNKRQLCYTIKHGISTTITYITRIQQPHQYRQTVHSSDKEYDINKQDGMHVVTVEHTR